MAFQIPNALIPCYVVQMNNTVFIQGDQIIGRVLEIPCKNDFIDDPNYWAVPVKDAGIFTTLEYYPVAQYPDPPTYDSFPVFRVRDKLSGYSWWIYGTQQNFVSSCSTCCGAGALPMPNTAGGFVINIAPCSTVGAAGGYAINDLGQFYMRFALPTLIGSEVYYPYGSYDNVAFPTASGAGYATPTLLLAYLNTVWGNIGSPNVSIVWTLSADNLTLTATMTSGAVAGDEICVVITTVGTSA